MLIKKKNFLDMVPALAQNVELREEKDELCTFVVTHKGFYHTLAQKCFKKPRQSVISLDEYGFFVAKHIDGNRSIYEIGLLIRRQFGEEAEPLFPRLVIFFRMLKNNEFIVYRK